MKNKKFDPKVFLDVQELSFSEQKEIKGGNLQTKEAEIERSWKIRFFNDEK